MKILLAVDGSESTRKLLDDVTSQPMFDERHEYTVFNAQAALPGHAAASLGGEATRTYHEQEAAKVLQPALARVQERGFRAAQRLEDRPGRRNDRRVRGGRRVRPDRHGHARLRGARPPRDGVGHDAGAGAVRRPGAAGSVAARRPTAELYAAATPSLSRLHTRRTGVRRRWNTSRRSRRWP